MRGRLLVGSSPNAPRRCVAGGEVRYRQDHRTELIAVSGSPLNPSGFTGGDEPWSRTEAADPIRLELAARGARHVLGILREWVGDQADRLEWEYGWVISVEERFDDWEVVVQGLTGEERVLSLLVPEPIPETLDLRLAVDWIYKDGSAVVLFEPADSEHPVGENCDGILIGVIPERVENFGQRIPLVSAGQEYGLLPEWWPAQASLPPIPAAA